jgi:hypothetical protein
MGKAKQGAKISKSTGEKSLIRSFALIWAWAWAWAWLKDFLKKKDTNLALFQRASRSLYQTSEVEATLLELINYSSS